MRDGDIVGGRYRIEELSRSGGMADIYRAVDDETGEPVAIKVVRNDVDASIPRFEREAALLANLSHPAIVGYRAHGRTAAGEYYLVMEWLEGEDLGARLARADLTVGESLRLIARVAQGLEQAHRAGVVHRDIKPSNLFLPEGKTARVKLIDFGIAQLMGGQTLQTNPTMTLGSPGYMSPEQARSGASIGPAADTYSLGCVLFRCLTGRRPFEGDSPMAVLLKTVIESPPRVSDLRADVPAELDRLVAAMLAKRPRDRPPSAAAVADELSAIALAKTARRARPEPALTTSEQRIVSLVLVDISVRAETGAVARARTDERAALFDALSEQAADYGGALHQVSDRLIAVTLEGSAAVEQSARAARCALAMRDTAPGAPIALATGRGNVLPLPMGDVIDRAVAMLQRVVDERTRASDTQVSTGIRVDDPTAGLLGARFRLVSDELGAVLDSERTVEAARTLLGKPTPFVGRIRELGFLEAIFDETVSESTANAALVTAAAGVGKSRLRHEFLRSLRRRKRPTELLVGRGDPIGAGAPFSTIAPAIRRAAGFAPGDSETERLGKLRDRLGRHLDGKSLARVWNFLSEMVGLRSSTKTDIQLRAARSDPILMGDQMRRAWLEWLGAELDAQPVVLVLEDLHWGDRPSVSFVDEALKLFADQPLMVLAFGRPEVRELFPELWSDRPLTAIELRELSRSASAQLVRDVLSGVADNVVDHLVVRAQGNAFYLEELIRAVAEGRSELPDSVLAMVQARLQEVDADCRRILRAASIFGRAFTPTGVRALLGGPSKAPRLRTQLRELASRELITRRDPSGQSDDIWYTFRHALLRDAAYATLTDQDRELGHRLAGDWLASRPGTDPVTLAEHFQRGGRPDRALEWYGRAAIQALEGNDFDAVHQCCARGAECAQQPAERGRLLVLRAEAYRWQGMHPDALTHARTAMAELPPGGAHWLRAAGLAATSAGNTNDVDILVDLAAALLAVSPSRSALADYLIAMSRAGDRLLMLGRHSEAEPVVERMRQLATHQAANEPAVAGWMHRIRGFHALFRGDPATFTQRMMAAARCFGRAGDARNACLQRGNAGYGYLHGGDYDRAEELLREALATAIYNDLGNVITSVQVDLGLALCRKGQASEAVHLLDEVAARCQRQGIKRLEGPARAYLADALAEIGDVTRAEEQARQAVVITADHPAGRATALATLARVLLKQQRAEHALRAANRAMGQLQLIGEVNEGESMVRLVYAETLLAVGQTKAARDAIRVARQRIEERAQLIRDPGFRRSFVEGDVANARTLELDAVLESAG